MFGDWFFAWLLFLNTSLLLLCSPIFLDIYAPIDVVYEVHIQKKKLKLDMLTTLVRGTWLEIIINTKHSLITKNVPVPLIDM